MGTGVVLGVAGAGWKLLLKPNRELWAQAGEPPAATSTNKIYSEKSESAMAETINGFIHHKRRGELYQINQLM